MPKVSVVMSVFNNDRRHLMDSIQSILNQTFKDLEFIIINDCSEDIDPYVRAVLNSFKDNRIKLITNGRNIGITGSLNKGLLVSSGEYIARQDADDVSELARLQTQIDYLDRYPEIGVIGTGTTIINGIGEKIDKWDSAPNPMESLKVRNSLIHGSVMFRRTVMDDVGKYDEQFKYAQDYEYWLRISKKHQIRNLPDRLYQYRIHNERISSAKTEEQARYIILAQRKAAQRPGTIMDINKEMTRGEKICYHSILVYNYIQRYAFTEANTQINMIFKLDPLNIENLIRKLAYILKGGDGIIYIQNMYRKPRKEIPSRTRESAKEPCQKSA